MSYALVIKEQNNTYSIYQLNNTRCFSSDVRHNKLYVI